MNEKVLGHFFSYKRSVINPQEYAIQVVGRRRVTGLTREEVAEMAHISTDWYTRIEQGRANSTPSLDVLNSIMDVLKLSASEKKYVLNLVNPSEIENISGEDASVEADLKLLLANQLPNIAFYTDNNLTIRAVNEVAETVYGLHVTGDLVKDNLIWQTFNSGKIEKMQVDVESYKALRTAQFRYIYSRTAESEFLYQIFSAVKNDDDFKKSWDELAVRGLQMNQQLIKVATNDFFYLTEIVLKSVDTNGFIFIQQPADDETKSKLVRLLHGTRKEK